jgi:hypothetical protein
LDSLVWLLVAVAVDPADRQIEGWLAAVSEVLRRVARRLKRAPLKNWEATQAHHLRVVGFFLFVRFRNPRAT